MDDDLRADITAMHLTVRLLLDSLEQPHRDAIRLACMALALRFEQRTDTPGQVAGARLQSAVERLFASLPASPRR